MIEQTPDPPEPERMFTFHTSSQSPARRVSCHNCDWQVEGDDPDLFAQADEHVCASPAASPDERLREALNDLLDAAAPYLERAHPDEKLWHPPDYHNYQRLAGAIAAARVVAAADREAPDGGR